MPRERKNLSESILERLKNLARQTKRRTDELLRYFAIERFLYRLSESQHCNKFFLKGGLMLRAWQLNEHRPTLDIDLLGKTKNNAQNLQRIVQDICGQEVIRDGITYETDGLRITEIQVDGDYLGARILFRAKLHSAKIPMQLDIGFSDLIFPKPCSIAYPALLEFPAPKLRGYTAESVIAEKFEAMAKLGLVNTRLKDFYDIWILLKGFSFRGESLQGAMQATFDRRKSSLDRLPDSLSKEFYSDPAHIKRWQKFLQQMEFENAIELTMVISDIKDFLQPIVDATFRKQLFNLSWSYEKKWR